jgi:polysaccharide pyruvyl transferase WcaK-like protein
MKRQDSSLRDVFVILTGVSGNLGDAVIRRRVLEWSRPVGRIHAYVGRTTDGWVEQLGMREGEAVYAAGARKEWLRHLLFGRGKRVLVFDPGEVPLGREHLKSEIIFFLIVLALRFRGAHIVRPPRAAGDYYRATAFFYRLGSKLSHVVLWRDRPSLELLRVGELSPDTAFAEPAVVGVEHRDRRTMLVTMRGKRARPSDGWFDGIAAFAKANDLHIVTMAQVDEDEQRCAEIAARLEAEYRPWGSRTDLEQEVAIRALYGECAYVISDRLHVLILAAKAGATPVEIAPQPAAKIRTHFATIGYDGLSLDSSAVPASKITAFLSEQTGRNPELVSKVEDARVRLGRRIAEVLPAR